MAQRLPRTRRRRRRRGAIPLLGRGKKQIEQPLVHLLLREILDFVLALVAHHVDGALHQVAHHGLYIATHVADLGELGRLDLDEGRARQPREATRDLRLSDARGADEDDVVGRDLLAHLLARLLAAPAVAERDGHGLLRLGLSHYVSVQLGHDLAGSEIRQTTDSLLSTIGCHYP